MSAGTAGGMGSQTRMARAGLMSMNRKQAVSIALVAWLLPGAAPGGSLGA